MHAPDRAAFATCIDRVYATWGKPTPSERVLAAAWDALEDFDLDIVEAACRARIAAGGRFVPSTADLLDECRIQRQQSHSRYTPTTVGDDVCDRCDGCGQIETRREDYEAAPVGKAARVMVRTYWAPCPSCLKGRRLAANRQRTTTTPRHESRLREAS